MSLSVVSAADRLCRANAKVVRESDVKRPEFDVELPELRQPGTSEQRTFHEET
jgi:hypothetical protein